MPDTWGLLMEGPTMQTFPSKFQASKWADSIASFWGARPEMFHRENGGQWRPVAESGDSPAT